MEKFICLLAVLTLTAPVFAGDVVLYADNIGDLKLEVGYLSYTGEPPVALALKVDAGVGNDVIAAYVPGSTSFFDVFIDYIAQSEYVNPGDYELGADPDTGSHPDAYPTANPDPDPALGIYALDLSTQGPVQVVALCMGSLTTDILDAGTWAPNAKTPLAILEFTDATTGVEIGHDTARGSIIDASGVSMAATISIDGDPAGPLPGVIDIQPAGCACRGDVNDDGKISPADISAVMSYLSPAYKLASPAYTCTPVPAGDECYDVNEDGKISPADISAVMSFLSPDYKDASPAYTYVGCMP